MSCNVLINIFSYTDCRLLVGLEMDITLPVEDEIFLDFSACKRTKRRKVRPRIHKYIIHVRVG